MPNLHGWDAFWFLGFSSFIVLLMPITLTTCVLWQDVSYGEGLTEEQYKEHLREFEAKDKTATYVGFVITGLVSLVVAAVIVYFDLF